MTLCVLDASAALAMTLADERRGEDQLLLEKIGVEGAIVTGLWHLEIANVLMMIVRRSGSIARNKSAHSTSSHTC